MYQTTATDDTGTESHPPKLVLTVDEAIERLGMGTFQRRILWAAGLCFAADSMEVLLLSFLAIVLQQRWDLTANETALITSVVFVGALLGTLVLGYLGDLYGRRKVFSLTSFIICVFGFLTAAAPNYETLLCFRFGVGFGVGGLTVPFDTLAEYLPTSCRGTNLLVIEYFWTAGTLLVPVLAYVSLGSASTNEESADWRLFCVLCAIPCVISTVLGLLYVPESPRWLVTHRSTVHSQQAIDILRSAARINGKDPDELFPLYTELVEDETDKEQHDGVLESKPQRERCLDLLSSRWIRLSLALWTTWFGFAITYYGTIIFVTIVFAVGDKDEDGEGFSFDYTAIFASASSEVVGTTFVLLTVDRLGRVPTQIISYVGGGISLLVFALLARNEESSSRAMLVVLAFFSRFFFMGGCSTTWVATAECLPTDIRASGHATANAIARIGGVVVPFLVSEDNSYQTIGSVLFAFSMVTAIAVGQLPETKDQSMGSIIARREQERDVEIVNRAGTSGMHTLDYGGIT